MVKNHRRWLAVSVIAIIVASGTGASAANDNKSPLLANASGNCTTGATAGTPTGGFAIIHATGSGNLVAQVSVKDLAPNHEYTLALVQTPSGSDCLASEATLTTNGNGNGNAHISEVLRAGTTGAFILVQPSDANGFVASSPTTAVG